MQCPLCASPAPRSPAAQAVSHLLRLSFFSSLVRHLSRCWLMYCSGTATSQTGHSTESKQSALLMLLPSEREQGRRLRESRLRFQRNWPAPPLPAALLTPEQGGPLQGLSARLCPAGSCSEASAAQHSSTATQSQRRGHTAAQLPAGAAAPTQELLHSFAHTWHHAPRLGLSAGLSAQEVPQPHRDPRPSRASLPLLSRVPSKPLQAVSCGSVLLQLLGAKGHLRSHS